MTQLMDPIGRVLFAAAQRSRKPAMLRWLTAMAGWDHLAEIEQAINGESDARYALPWPADRLGQVGWWRMDLDVPLGIGTPQMEWSAHYLGQPGHHSWRARFSAIGSIEGVIKRRIVAGRQYINQLAKSDPSVRNPRPFRWIVYVTSRPIGVADLVPRRCSMEAARAAFELGGFKAVGALGQDQDHSPHAEPR
jgi:hypothetical protein